MNNKIKKSLSYFSLFILALGMLPLGNILADEKVEPTKFVIEQNNLEANGFKIANDQVLTSEDVVKLSNVKSVDNLVDVNSLTVSNDQLANVNQANPDGGLYNLTLTNGQQATITVPVVKEGSLVTANSKGALIFKNLALSQEANSKQKVLEETGVYSVAFNNGYVNSDLTVDINKNSTVVKDTNLGLSKEIPNNMSSQEGHNRSKILNFQQPNPDSSILETGKTNPEKSVSMADENFAALTRAVTPINVTSWKELKEKVNSQASGELQVYALPENISIDNTTITISKGQRVVITSQASKTTVSIGEGNNRLYTNLFKVTNGILDVNNVDFVGTLPEGAVAAKTLGVGPTNSANLSKNVFVIDSANARANFYKNIEFKNQKIYLDGYGAFADIQNGATSNTYGGKFHNLQAGVWGGTFNVGPGSSTANYFLGEYYDQWNTSNSGPFDQWNTQPTLIQRWFGTSIHDNYSKSQGAGFAFTVQGNNATGDNTNGQGNQQVYGKTKIYNNYLYDSASGAITQKCNWGAVYNAPKASGKYDKLVGVNKIYNPTPDTNVWIGQTEHANMDSYFDSNPYGGANGYVALAEIVYTDASLAQKYANNGVAEGIHGDWEDASNANGTITNTGNYRVIEKQIEGKNYAVLVKSATEVTVKGVDNSVPQKTLYIADPISIPSVGKSIINVKEQEGYTITGAKVKSNTGSGISPETVLTPVKDASGAIIGFEINPNNNELGIKELTVEVQYEKIVNNKAEITANNFKLKLNTDTASLTADTAKTKANADASYLDGHTPKPTINVDEAQLNAIKAANNVGVMDLTFTVANDAQATPCTVKVSIYDDNTVFPPDESKFLHAKDFTITDAEAKTLTEATAKDKAGVKAWNADGTDLTPNVAVDSAQLAKIKKGVAGVYPLKFTVDGLEKTVNVSVTDEYTVAGDKAAIKAKNFRLVLNAETASLTADIAKEKAEADAWYLDGHTPKPTINVDEAQLNAIKAATKAGVMDLTFTVADDPNATRTVKVTILDNSVIDGQAFLSAKNFTITDEEAKALTEATAKDKAEVKAWIADGTDLTPNVAVDPAQLTKIKEGVAGVYPLKFTVDGLEKTVNVTVTDENTVVGDKAAIRAKNFKLKLNAETASLTADVAKAKAEADAWYLDGHTPKPTINVDEAQLNAIKTANGVGVMDLTFTVADNAKATGTVARTVKVTIYDDNTEISPDKFLHANDFTITDEEAKALTEAAAKDKAGVKAWNADGTDLTPNVAVDPAQLAKIKEGVAGVYPLKFTVDGLERTVNVTITTNTIILPGLDNKPGTPDDVVVKPKPDQNGNYPKPNPDGSVTLPGGGEITIPGTGNDDITIAPPGSSIKPDGTITTPSGNEVRPNPEGGVELPGQDGSITNKPQDNPLVKPNGNGPITVNPDGSVTLPPNENGTITFPNNPDNNGVTNFPGGSTIKPDGTVVTPNGNQVRPNPEGGVELPGIDRSITNNPQDNPVVKPEGNGPITINPDGSVTLPNDQNGTVTFPNGKNDDVTNFPGGSTIKPDGTIITPNGNQVRPNPEGGVELPGNDGSITNNPQDNPLVKPEGNGPITVNPDGSVTLPNDQNGTVTFPNNPDNNNEITIPNGSNIGQNGQVTPPGGSPVLPNANGTITIPGADGNLGTPDDGIVTPNGNSTINPDGSLTLPGGGTVDLPGCQLTVEPGGVVLPNGAVINPGANGVLDTPGYAPQAPGADNKTNTRAIANNEQANQGQQDATNQPNGNNTANSNVNDDVYLDPTIVCATPVVKPTTQPTAKPQTPTGAASQVVLYAPIIIAAAVGTIVVIRRNRK